MLVTALLAFGSIAYTVATDLDVEWVKPEKGSLFATDEKIQCVWKVDKAVVSPSFKLCSRSGSSKQARRSSSSSSSSTHGGDNGQDDGEGDDDAESGGAHNCGFPIWPLVHSGNDTNTFQTSMVAPNVTTKADYYILMTDNFEHSVSSFQFIIKPKDMNAEAAPTTSMNTAATAQSEIPEAGPPVVYPPSGPQFPAAAAAALSASPSTPTVSEVPTSPLPIDPSPASVSQPPLHSPSNPVASAAPSAPPVLGVPSFLTAHSPPPVAAIAVPASIAGAILLLASILGIDHHLKQRRLRKSEKEALATKVARFEVEEKRKEQIGLFERFAPVPLYMPSVAYTDLPRRETRQSISSRRSSISSRYAYAYPAMHGGIPRPPSTPPVYSFQRQPPPPAHSFLPPMRTSSPLSYPVGFREPTPLPYTYAHERRDEPVPITQSILTDYLPPPPPLPRPPEGLLPAPHRAYLREAASPLSDNPYVRSPRT